MVRRFKKFDPQLVVVEHTAGSAIALTNEAKLSLYKKSQKSGIPTNILETVYYRGYSIWNESFDQTPEQFAFDRVNSFIAGGFAAELDDDLLEDAKGYKNPTGGLTQKGRDHYNRTTGSNLKAPVTTPPSKLKAGSKAANRRKSFCARMGGMEGPMKKPNGEPTRKALALRKWNCEETQIDEKTCNCWDGYKRVPGTKPCAPGSCAKPSAINEKRGLWDNIHAKRERIKNGSGEHMRKPGSKGAPTAAALKNSQNEEALKEAVQPKFRNRIQMSTDWQSSGRADKDANIGDTMSHSNNIVHQLHKNIDLHGQHDFKFDDGSTTNVSKQKSYHILDKLSGMKGPDKHKAVVHMGKSKEHFDKFHNEEYICSSTLNEIKKVVRESLEDSDTSRLKKFAKELKDKDAEIKVKTSVSLPPEEREKHPALELPTKYADRKAVAAKQTPSGVKKPDINGDIQREINSRLAPVLGGLKQKMDGKFRQNSISRMSEENND